MSGTAAVPVRGTTQVVGVFGYPVRHSASPPMHNAAFAALGLDWVYVPFPVDPQTIGEAVAGIRALGLRGANVTVPLKERVPPHLDSLTPRARALGVANTIVNEDGLLRGDSTDGPGFLAALEQGGLSVTPGLRAVVLGAGGSARAVVYALAEAGAQVTIANRSHARAAAIAEEFAGIGALQAIALTTTALAEPISQAALLVNTTSIGMHPHEDVRPPVPIESLHPDLFVSDLVYNPTETRLLALARRQGCRIQNGVEMLVQQGALSFQQWTGISPPTDVMRAAVKAALNKEED